MPSRRLHFAALVSLLLLGVLISPLGLARSAAASDTPTPNLVVIPGTIQSKLGCPGDWQPDCEKTALTYNAEKDVWEGTFDLPKGHYEYKVALNGTWAENYGLDAKRDGPNIPLVLTQETQVAFTYDHETHSVTDSVNEAAGGPSTTPVELPPDLVVVPGTFQDELGCPGAWQPECDVTSLTYDPEDDVWQGAFDLPANLDEKDAPPRYKVALNGGWGENYGEGAIRGGPDIKLLLSAPTRVKFYYDHRTHWIADSVNYVIATVVGNFQTELGCGKDDDPGCLQSWLQDPDGDGVYSFTTTGIPVGNYEARVSIGESPDEIYGQGGDQGAAGIPFTVLSDGKEIYFAYDPGSHLLTVSTEGAPRGNIGLAKAHWVTEDTIAWRIEPPAEGTVFQLHYDPEGQLKLEPNGITGGQSVPLRFSAGGLETWLRVKFPHLAGLESLSLDPRDLDKIRSILKGQLAVSAVDQDGKLLDATALQIPGLLDDIYRYDGPLGVTYEGEIPTLRVWAPTARSVMLHLYDDSATTADTTVPMAEDAASGVWSAAGTADWTGKYYLYEVEVYVPSTGKVEKNLVTDPYSLSLSTNSQRSQIVNLDDSALMPEGWEALSKPPLDAPEDSVIYELHIRDFSIGDETVPADERGTYMAFTALSSNGMKHLRALAEAGLTHVHLLPAFDIASVDEDKSGWATVDEAELAGYPPDSEKQQEAVGAVRSQDGFNWGYDPYHYSVPEGSYSTDPDGPIRILEFRRMVQALNGIGLRVVMDVVYNHTNSSGQNDKSVLDKVVPGYYHRLNGDGKVQTSTCCQNTASEHAMMEKLMIDSVLTWARAYKVDGFRFDLMGHHMVSNMISVRRALDSLTLETDGVDGTRIIVYGEGWNFGEVANDARGKNATQLNVAGTGIGTFNDRLRDGARGGGPFGDPREQGFLTGLYDDPSAYTEAAPETQRAKLLGLEDWIRVTLAGNLKDYVLVDAAGNTVSGSEVDYNGSPAGYALDPQENIVYISAHDNETLFDALQWKAPASATVADRVRMQNLGVSLVMLAQGIPFFHAGDDMLRSKSLDGNSYDSGDWFNKLDFSYESNNWGVGLPSNGTDRWPLMARLLADPALKPSKADILAAVAHFREMLQIRRSSRLFRLRTADEVIRHLSFLNTGPDQIPGVVVVRLSDTQAEDLDPNLEEILVVFNATKAPVTFADASLGNLAFELHPVQAASNDPLVRQSAFNPAAGAFSVPGRTAAVFVLPSGEAESGAAATVTPASAATEPEGAPTQVPQPTEAILPTASPESSPAASGLAWLLVAGVALGAAAGLSIVRRAIRK